MMNNNASSSQNSRNIDLIELTKKFRQVITKTHEDAREKKMITGFTVANLSSPKYNIQSSLAREVIEEHIPNNFTRSLADAEFVGRMIAMYANDNNFDYVSFARDIIYYDIVMLNHMVEAKLAHLVSDECIQRFIDVYISAWKVYTDLFIKNLCELDL